MVRNCAMGKTRGRGRGREKGGGGRPKRTHQEMVHAFDKERTMGKTEGTCTKRRKKTADDWVHLAQQNARVTRSKAANNQNQLVRAISVRCTKKTPDAALKPVPVAAVDITKGTKGVASNPPKLTGCIEKNGASSPNTNKQQADECIDENSTRGNQGSCSSGDSSRNCNPSNEFERHSCMSLQKITEFERLFVRPAGEDDDGRDYAVLKKEEVKETELIVEKEKQIDWHKEMLANLEAEVVALRSESVKAKHEKESLMEKGLDLLKKYLVHGLLV